MTDPTTIALSETVYTAHDEFGELAHDILDNISGNSGSGIIRNAIGQLLEAVGRDPVKLHTLVGVVQEKIMRSAGWANLTGVAFYTLLIEEMDKLNLVADDDFQGEAADGVHTAQRYILDRCISDFQQLINDNHDWHRRHVKHMIDFVVKNVEDGGPLSPKDLSCGLLEQMIDSFFTNFNDNLGVLFDFCVHIRKYLDNASSGAQCEHLTKLLQRLINDDKQRSVEQTQRVEMLMERRPVELVNTMNEKHFRLFRSEENWSARQTGDLLRAVSASTTIGMSLTAEKEVYGVVKAMVVSEHLFSGSNLRSLISFLLSKGGVLDAMNGNHSQHLTVLLDELQAKSKGQSVQHRHDIEGLRAVLGRTDNDLKGRPVDEVDAEDRLAKAVSRLDFNS